MRSTRASASCRSRVPSASWKSIGPTSTAIPVAEPRPRARAARRCFRRSSSCCGAPASSPPSTGFPYAPPFAFLFVALRARRGADDRRRAGHAARAGRARRRSIAISRSWRSCVHALYLGGVFVALDGGMAAGTSAMLVGLQPILTVVLAWRLDARSTVSRAAVDRAWCSGLAGVYFVVRHKIDFGGDLRGLVPSAVALVAISVGTLYQKRHCAHVDLRSGVGGAVHRLRVGSIAPLAFLLDTRPVQWTPPFVFALGWSVLVLSVGAISLLYWLLRHGAAANVARLFYLVPPVTALDGVPAVRRDARCAGADRDGVDHGRRDACAAPAHRSSRTTPSAARCACPAKPSCRNCRSGSTNAHRKLKRDEPQRVRAEPYRASTA